MAREFKRSDRVADALQRELAVLLRDEVGDPRVRMVNITAVEPSRDLATAKVFVNFVAPLAADELKVSMAALKGAVGFLRTALAKRMQLRITPKLTFVYDASGHHGQHLAALIDLALAQDRLRYPAPAAPDAEDEEQTP